MLEENIIKHCVSGFDISEENYTARKFESYTLHHKGGVDTVNCKITTTARNNHIYIGRNLTGKTNIKISGKNNLVYIGNDCNLKDFTINLKGRGIKIIIGNGVTCTADCYIIAGQNAAPEFSNILIGDDVMMAKHCSVYSSDNHPIYDIESFERINLATKDVIIEPHVWLGQNSMVNKSTTVGAGSIIAAGAIVTRDVPRFSLVAGIPAKIIKRNVVWSRHEGAQATDKAKDFVEIFSATPNKE